MWDQNETGRETESGERDRETDRKRLTDVQFSSVQSLTRVRLFATPWITALQASLSITNSRNLLKLMSIKTAMPSSHLILCRPLLLLPPIPPSIRVFSNESTLHMKWAKYWSFSFSISPSNEHLEVICLRMDWLTDVTGHVKIYNFFSSHASTYGFTVLLFYSYS